MQNSQGLTMAAKGAYHFCADGGLHGPDLLAGQDPHPGDAVLVAPVKEGMYRLHLLLVKGQDKGTDLLALHRQLFAELLGHPDSLHIEAGHFGPRLRVVPGVEDGAVGLGGAVRHVVGGLQGHHLQVIPGKLVGSGGADDPAADDRYIIHHLGFPFFPFGGLPGGVAGKAGPEFLLLLRRKKAKENRTRERVCLP